MMIKCKGETPSVAVYREMHEEIGLSHSDVRFIACTRQWFKYDLPENARRKRSIRGQRQKWFLFLLVSPETKINLNTDKCQEFTDYQWVDLDEVQNMVIPFKQPVYAGVVAEFRPFIERLKINP